MSQDVTPGLAPSRASWRWPALVALYLASRLFRLTVLPVFLDERIHLRWAEWVSQGDRLRLPFISGRGLNVYLLAAITPHSADPLLTGRLLTVAVGLVCLWGCRRLAHRLTADPAVADLAALLYVVCPFALFHDRMVLNDSFLAAATALTLVAAVRLAETAGLRAGLLTGLAMAGGILSKATGLFLLPVPILAVALDGRQRARAAGPLFAAYAVAALLTAYPLWLFFTRTSELVGALGMRENESSYAGNAAGNFRLAAQWLWTYWTPPLALLAVAGVGSGLAARARRGGVLLLTLVGLGPALVFVAVSEIWYPRYLLPMTVPMVVLAASGVMALTGALRRRAPWSAAAVSWLGAALLGAALVPALRFDAALLTDPARAPFPPLDRLQYVTGWPSGYGLRDSIAFLREASTRAPGGLLLVTPGRSVTASAVRSTPSDAHGIEVRYVDPSEGAARLAALAAESGRPVFVIESVAESTPLPAAWADVLRPVFASFKPDGRPADRIYRACADGAC